MLKPCKFATVKPVCDRTYRMGVGGRDSQLKDQIRARIYARGAAGQTEMGRRRRPKTTSRRRPAESVNLNEAPLRGSY